MKDDILDYIANCEETQILTEYVYNKADKLKQLVVIYKYKINPHKYEKFIKDLTDEVRDIPDCTVFVCKPYTVCIFEYQREWTVSQKKINQYNYLGKNEYIIYKTYKKHLNNLRRDFKNIELRKHPIPKDNMQKNILERLDRVENILERMEHKQCLDVMVDTKSHNNEGIEMKKLSRFENIVNETGNAIININKTLTRLGKYFNKKIDNTTDVLSQKIDGICDIVSNSINKCGEGFGVISVLCDLCNFSQENTLASLPDKNYYLESNKQIKALKDMSVELLPLPPWDCDINKDINQKKAPITYDNNNNKHKGKKKRNDKSKSNELTTDADDISSGDDNKSAPEKKLHGKQCQRPRDSDIPINNDIYRSLYKGENINIPYVIINNVEQASNQKKKTIIIMHKKLHQLYLNLDIKERKEMFRQIYPHKWSDLTRNYTIYATKINIINRNLLADIKGEDYVTKNGFDPDKLDEILGDMRFETSAKKTDFFIYTEYRMGLNMSEEHQKLLINKPEFYNEGDTIDMNIYPHCIEEKRVLIWHKICRRHELFTHRKPLKFIKLYEKLFGIIDHPDIKLTQEHKGNQLEIDHYKMYGVLICASMKNK